MNRISRFPLVLVLVVALALLPVSFASAQPLGNPQVFHQTAGAWFEAVLRWLETLTGVDSSRSAQKVKPETPISPTEGGNNSTMGGSCIDPAGCAGPGGG